MNRNDSVSEAEATESLAGSDREADSRSESDSDNDHGSEHSSDDPWYPGKGEKVFFSSFFFFVPL